MKKKTFRHRSRRAFLSVSSGLWHRKTSLACRFGRCLNRFITIIVVVIIIFIIFFIIINYSSKPASWITDVIVQNGNRYCTINNFFRGPSEVPGLKNKTRFFRLKIDFIRRQNFRRELRKSFRRRSNI